LSLGLSLCAADQKIAWFGSGSLAIEEEIGFYPISASVD